MRSQQGVFSVTPMPQAEPRSSPATMPPPSVSRYPASRSRSRRSCATQPAPSTPPISSSGVARKITSRESFTPRRASSVKVNRCTIATPLASSAPAPHHVAALHLTRKRIDCPVRRVRRHDVQMREQDDGLAASAAAENAPGGGASQRSRAARSLDHLGLEPRLAQATDQQLGERLFVPRGADGAEADRLGEQGRSSGSQGAGSARRGRLGRARAGESQPCERKRDGDHRVALKDQQHSGAREQVRGRRPVRPGEKKQPSEELSLYRAGLRAEG